LTPIYTHGIGKNLINTLNNEPMLLKVVKWRNSSKQWDEIGFGNKLWKWSLVGRKVDKHLEVYAYVLAKQKHAEQVAMKCRPAVKFQVRVTWCLFLTAQQ